MKKLGKANCFSAVITFTFLSFFIFLFLTSRQSDKSLIKIEGQDYMCSNDSAVASLGRPPFPGYKSLQSTRILPLVTFLEASIGLFNLFERDENNGNVIMWVENELRPFYQRQIPFENSEVISSDPIHIIYECSQHLTDAKKLMMNIAEDDESKWCVSKNPCICCVADLVDAFVKHVDAISGLENKRIVTSIKKDLKFKLPKDLTFSNLLTVGAKLKRELQLSKKKLQEVLPFFRAFVKFGVVKHVDHRYEPTTLCCY